MTHYIQLNGRPRYQCRSGQASMLANARRNNLVRDGRASRIRPMYRSVDEALKVLD